MEQFLTTSTSFTNNSHSQNELSQRVFIPHQRDVNINHIPQESPPHPREVGPAGFAIRNARPVSGEVARNWDITMTGRGRQAIRNLLAARGSSPRRQRIQIIMRRPVVHGREPIQNRGTRSPSRINHGRTLRRIGRTSPRQNRDRPREIRQRVSIHIRGDSSPTSRRNSRRQESATGCGGLDEALQLLRLESLRDSICADDVLRQVELLQAGFHGVDEEMVELEGRLAGLTVCLG